MPPDFPIGAKPDSAGRATFGGWVWNPATQAFHFLAGKVTKAAWLDWNDTGLPVTGANLDQCFAAIQPKEPS